MKLRRNVFIGCAAVQFLHKHLQDSSAHFRQPYLADVCDAEMSKDLSNVGHYHTETQGFPRYPDNGMSISCAHLQTSNLSQKAEHRLKT
jgi:hypothetical protein